jgi:hypothetical protein
MKNHRHNALLLTGAGLTSVAAFLFSMFGSSSGDDTGKPVRVQISDPCGRTVLDARGKPVTIELDEADPPFTPTPAAVELPTEPEETVPVVWVPASPGAVLGVPVTC